MKRKGNRIEIAGDVARVHMVGGRVAVVDAADVPLVQEYTWCVSRKGYAVTMVTDLSTSRRSYPLMHRLLLGLPYGPGSAAVVDHLNRDKLDNRRVNLEVTSNRENIIRGLTSKLNPVKVSRFVGVHWNKGRGHWQAQIHNKALRCETYLGRFSCEEQAAAAYQRARSLIESGAMGEFWSNSELRRALRSP